MVGAFSGLKRILKMLNLKRAGDVSRDPSCKVDGGGHVTVATYVSRERGRRETAGGASSSPG